ncbi:MAG TPA: hypothetical protein VIJ28_01440, partial [Chloroflexota bacterium]
DVVIVLLTPQTHVMLPNGVGLAELDPGQMVTATGTINWRTHTLVRPTSLTIGATVPTPSCETLPAAGERTCPEPQPTATP